MAEEAEEKEIEKTEGEEGAEATSDDAAKKKKKKLIIIGAAAALVLILGGVGAFFALSGKSGGEKAAEEEHAAEGGEAVKPVYYTLPEFLVNLNTTGKQSSFLKATIILEVAKSGDVAIIEANLPLLQDAMNTYLRELRSPDLAGSAGLQRLREELLLRANKSLEPVKINRVLFKEIVVQ